MTTMTTASVQQTLDSVIDSIANASLEERNEIRTEEEIMDCFLDELNDFKKAFTKRATDIIDISERMSSLTWYSNPDEDTLKKLYSLIVLAKDARRLMVIKYVQCNGLRTKGIAKDAISFYKEAMDDLKEAYIDLERVFFTYPKDEEFQKINLKIAS